MRQLNACGFSSETIAAEYETDAALAEAGNDLEDPYFLAAFAAENEQRDLDRAIVRQSDQEQLMTTPSDELRTAAETLRNLTTDLGDCRGPWYVVNREQRPYPQRIDNIGVPYVVASTTTDPSHPPTIADYICAMHPGVGKTLADWLDSAAVDAEQIGPDPHALAVARALLGGGQR